MGSESLARLVRPIVTRSPVVDVQQDASTHMPDQEAGEGGDRCNRGEALQGAQLDQGNRREQRKQPEQRPIESGVQPSGRKPRDRKADRETGHRGATGDPEGVQRVVEVVEGIAVAARL